MEIAFINNYKIDILEFRNNEYTNISHHAIHSLLWILNLETCIMQNHGFIESQLYNMHTLKKLSLNVQLETAPNEHGSQQVKK